MNVQYIMDTCQVIYEWLFELRKSTAMYHVLSFFFSLKYKFEGSVTAL